MKNEYAIFLYTHKKKKNNLIYVHQSDCEVQILFRCVDTRQPSQFCYLFGHFDARRIQHFNACKFGAVYI